MTYSRLDLINDTLGTVGVYATQEAAQTGAAPLRTYRLRADPQPGESVLDALLRQLATADPDTAELEAARSLMAVTPRQARLALHQSDLLTAVEAFVGSGDAALQIEWAHATEIRRTWPPVIQFAQANEISDADLDALFELAAAL